MVKGIVVNYNHCNLALSSIRLDQAEVKVVPGDARKDKQELLHRLLC